MALVDDGWINEGGDFFPWTNNADEVDEGDEILVEDGVVVNALGGDDVIIGTGGEIAILNFGTLDTGDGNDFITGTNIGDAIYNLRGKITTREGDDTIIGTSKNIGIYNEEGTLDTGDGNDDITGTGDLGFLNDRGTITTGNGNDDITGTGEDFGIVNGEGMIDTGKGNDTITGTGGEFGIGIDNDGTIKTGRGKDTVDALTGGFDGGGTIDLGRGKDLIRGFGKQNVFGGQGFDTAELGIDFNDQIVLGNAEDSSIDIKFDNETMAFTDVELFKFNNEVFILGQLQDLA